MSSVIVYTTSTQQAQQEQEENARRREHAARVHAMVSRAPIPVTATGRCNACGSIEVTLSNVTGSVDLSGIGESPAYPTGWGCELCD